MLTLFLTLTLAIQTPAEAVFSSAEFPAIFNPIWGDWHFRNGTWIGIVFGDSSQAQGISVFVWEEGQPLRKHASADAREGLFMLRNTDVSPSGQKLLVQGYGNSVAYLCSLVDQKGVFKRKMVVDHGDDFIFWDEKTVLSGSKFPSIRFAVHGRKKIAEIERLKAQLPTGIDHPVEPYYYKNKMHFKRHENKFAFAFGLVPEVYIWDGVKLTSHEVGFADYEVPTKKYPKDSRKYRKWFSSFHHLQQIAWFKGDLYGLFRKGYDEYGVWLRFHDQGSLKVWDNDANSIRIFAMNGEEMILGKRSDKAEGDVTWRLWRASSLPSL